jgi:hypothetical protein
MAIEIAPATNFSDKHCETEPMINLRHSRARGPGTAGPVASQPGRHRHLGVYGRTLDP